MIFVIAPEKIFGIFAAAVDAIVWLVPSIVGLHMNFSVSAWAASSLATLVLLTAPAAAQPAAAPPNADDLVVVDCRLPPKVRKLGTSMVYQAAGAVIRIPAKECELRGGEYTLLDPSSYGKAIQFWMAEAQRGDPRAQTNVGALYERMSPPDFAAAAQWYGKAAEAGFAPAQVALGQLYETGRGVPQDRLKALNLYRRAAGISDSTLTLVESAEPAKAPPEVQRQVDTLRQSLEESRKEIERLRRSLQKQRRNESETDRLRKKLAAAEQELAKRRQSLQRDGTRLASLPAPSIEIVYPLATRGGDRLQVKLRGTTNVDVIARVVSPLGIASVSVDGKRVPVDDQNMFFVSSAALAKGNPVRVAAVDLLDRTTEVELVGTAPAQRAEPATQRGAEPANSLKLGDFYALIIGNWKFVHWETIQNALNDARAVDELLRTKYGFETRLLINANRQEMLSAFNDLREQLTENDNLLVYYAGHGHMISELDRGYWIPEEAELNRDTAWILNEQITDYLQIIPAKRILVIADSCYSGVLTRSSVQRPRPGLDEGTRMEVLRQLSTKKVRTVMTSGGIQPVLDSGSDGHSVFAAALLKILRDNSNVLEANRLFDALSPLVVASSERMGYKQTPTYRAIAFAGHEGGDFLFIPRTLN